MDVWEEEESRAKLYRDRWDARIQFREQQLRALAGDPQALQALHAEYETIFRKDNYIGEATDPIAEDGGYVTPFDVDDDGAISSSPVRLRGTRHASDQNDRPHGG
jgi:hypothetical protein